MHQARPLGKTPSFSLLKIGASDFLLTLHHVTTEVK